jgi:hypothetical protein
MDLEAPSVLKRMKDKAFARAVNRDDLRKGAEELGLPLEEHVANVIAFLRDRAEALGLQGSTGSTGSTGSPGSAGSTGSAGSSGSIGSAG